MLPILITNGKIETYNRKYRSEGELNKTPKKKRKLANQFALLLMICKNRDLTKIDTHHAGYPDDRKLLAHSHGGRRCCFGYTHRL